ncbi:hypothetical protein AgCh_019828 [Apium graveolens]
MPRNPARRLITRPVTFSRFARLVALTSVCKVKRNSRSSKCSKNILPIFHGKEVDLALKDKKEQLESSDDEEFKEKSIQQDMKFMLGEQARDAGLVISQHVLNLSPQLLPPPYDGLFDEVSWATEDEPTEDLRKSFCFKHYLFVGKIYQVVVLDFASSWLVFTLEALLKLDANATGELAKTISMDI